MATPQHVPDFGYSQKPKLQTIYTPQCVIDAVLEVWPEGIACDPCAGPESLVPAFMRVFESGRVRTATLLDTAPDMDGGGLDPDFFWPNRTFVNPPYCDLKTWLPKCAATDECIALVPVRTHRTWWRDAVLQAPVVCLLNPLKFVGYPSTFPQPLAAMYFGHRTTTFRRAFAPLGDCLCLSTH